MQKGEELKGMLKSIKYGSSFKTKFLVILVVALQTVLVVGMPALNASSTRPSKIKVNS